MNAIIGIFRIIHVSCKNIIEYGAENMQAMIDKIYRQNLAAMLIVHPVVNSRKADCFPVIDLMST